MEHRPQVIGGVHLEPNMSFSAPEDDSFKLWASEQEGWWVIVYCVVLTEWDVDHYFWNGSRWQSDQIDFAESELGTQVAAAWQAREQVKR